ncbi:anti-sigma-D factor RsdA [Micromonospora chersina]|uniref:Anti-sigma-D factor RsdA to sigma factor binding region n=1 Tax=Micromonospora chersina TaxID=47854 RepID=A0A1C6U2D7_9ACTN|nr:anti-sigma-D factor RsdA [Micromonospora chersina]SCL48235.1 Anti-sigma-D factor RsdA to sigma factor binding region [Micromonospora chersina]
MTGRTPGDGDEAMDLGTIARDDALLDALGRGEPAPDGDALAGLLAAWRSDLAEEPTGVRPAAPDPVGDAPVRRAVRRPRPWALRLAAAAVALLALVSGLGISSRDAGPGSPLWSLTKLLHPQQAEVRGIEDTIDRARAALNAGRLDDAEALIAQARRDLARVEDPAAVTRLGAALDVVARDLAAARGVTAPPSAAPASAPASPAPTAVPSPTVTRTPRPGPATSGGSPRPGTSGSPAPADSPLLPLPGLPLPSVSVSVSVPGLPLPGLPLPTGGGLLD